MLNIAINGICGRMGKAILAESGNYRELRIVGGVDPRPESGAAEVKISADPAEILPLADVVIDFSNPAGAVQILNACRQLRKPLVSGSTALSDAEMKYFAEAAKEIAIVQAFNFSVGINILMDVSRRVAGLLKNSADVEIIDIHHRHKKDAPSGTTVSLAKAVEAGKGQSPWQKGRAGAELSRENEIGIHSLRGGSVIGEHQVHFLGENENLIFTHQALNRKIFVEGAFLAAKWISGKPAGLYGMNDALQLEEKG